MKQVLSACILAIMITGMIAIVPAIWPAFAPLGPPLDRWSIVKSDRLAWQERRSLLRSYYVLTSPMTVPVILVLDPFRWEKQPSRVPSQVFNAHINLRTRSSQRLVMMQSYGWPFRWLGCEYECGLAQSSSSITIQNAFPLSKIDTRAVLDGNIAVLPYGVNGTRLIVNVLVTTCIVLLILYVYRCIVIAHRRRYGKCIHCGYETPSQTAVCSECGMPSR
jgi:hypothetical protein